MSLEFLSDIYIYRIRTAIWIVTAVMENDAKKIDFLNVLHYFSVVKCLSSICTDI